MMKKMEPSVSELLKQKNYKEAELAAKERIRANSLEAQNWVFLGEALMHQGYGSAATKAFYRAWLLDPEATWVVPVIDALKEIPAGDERVDIEGLLHVRKVTVSAGIITYNMESTIERCLDSLQGAVDEIILIDCSTDRTAEIASQYPNVTIVPFVWVDDFAAARNEGLRHMNSDWVFWMDADEHLVKEDVKAIREAAGLYHKTAIPAILCLWQINSIQNHIKHNFSQARLFPLGKGLKYWGRVHEQVGTQSGVYNLEAQRFKVKIRVLHDGYEPSVMKNKQKIERNLKLLYRMVQEEPDNPAAWFYLGRDLLGAGKELEAIEALLEAERRALSQPLFGRLLDVYKYLMEISYHRKEWEHALMYGAKALSHHPDFPDAHYMIAQIRMKQADQLYTEAEAGMRRAREAFHSFRHMVSPEHEIGEWKVDLALAEIAQRAGKPSTAKAIYKQTLKQHPRTAGLISKKLAAIDTERKRLNQQSE
ncbi:glycosyltransferase [Paenibacillus sp. GCM10012304]